MITISDDEEVGPRNPVDALEADEEAYHAGVEEETQNTTDDAAAAAQAVLGNAVDPVTEAFADSLRSADESLSEKAAAATSHKHGSDDAEYAAGHTVKENVPYALREVADAAGALNLQYEEVQQLLQQVVGAEARAMQGADTAVPGFDVTDVEDTEAAHQFQLNDYGEEGTYELHDALAHGLVTPEEYSALVTEFGAEYDPLDATKDEIAEAYLEHEVYSGPGAAHSRASGQVRAYSAVNDFLED